MTYVNYLGCNHKLPIGNKYETEKLGLIDDSFFSEPDEGMENIRKHISSKYIYQVDTNGGGAILFDRYLKETSPHNYQKTISRKFLWNGILIFEVFAHVPLHVLFYLIVK
ncbi:hypothetical protein J7E55_26545 [Bacillus sp. ISL-53]|nr:hypothetical protein [Bacillus sp. ISL-53]